MAAHDWRGAPCGQPGDWEPALQHAVRQMLDAAVPMFIVWGSGETFLYNDAYLPILGQRHPAALGQPFAAAWPDAYPAVQPAVAQAMAGQPVSFENTPFTVTRNGVEQQSWFSFTYSPLRRLDGAVRGLSCVVAETTDRMREAQRLHDEASCISGLFRQSTSFIAVLSGPELVHERVNAAYMSLVGERDVIGLPLREALPELAEHGYQERLLHVMASGEPAVHRRAGIALRRVQDGAPDMRYVDFSIQPLGDAGGAVIALLVEGVDVTGHVLAERSAADSSRQLRHGQDSMRRGEAALRDAQLRLEGALGAAEVATWTWNLRENRVYADANLARLFGVSGQDAAGGPVEAYLAAIHPDDVARVGARIEGALASGDAFSDSYRVRGADGSYRYVEARGKLALGSDGQPEWLPGVVLDISAQKEAEARLRDSEARFRVIANAMPQSVWSTRPDGFHDYYNDQWYAFTGVPYGSTDGDGWNGLFHADDQPLAWEKWRHSLETGAPYEIEYRLRHHSGHYRWVLGRALPVRAEDGAIIRWMGTCTDIHEQKLAQQALQEADRRKDEFLAMLAHELRNPLAPIATAASLLALAANDPARVQQVAKVISRQAAHMTGLIDDLMDVSRVTRGLVTLERQAVTLAQVIDDALEQVRPLIESRQHALELQSAAGGAVVNGDRKRLVQVLANILGNAAKYTPAGGHIVLYAGIEDGCAVLRVRDNGVGMAPELVGSAFELFHQGTRSPDRSQGGLGVGLALVRSLVQLHGGTVHAASGGEGRGSTFTVRLPLPADQDGAARGPDAGAATAAPGALRVLVVDDNTDAAELVAMFLQLLGYEVSVEFGAIAALERARQVQPHICLLDIGLPGMDGNELARRLRQLPGLEGARMAAMTGYGQPHDRRETEAAGFDAHFVKPVETDALAAWLAGVGLPVKSD
ncbi:PAS domain S-box-containing protein [Massilia yuzhufengensis]|uniref:histidine kinase n=2 Tax=Massilia yuzhufengensis TaxID=1164594 RepID=A0A1I1P7W0_9BURK|nr:PAS domain S-box-containing protein [Massilia yuzhufengensis]